MRLIQRLYGKHNTQAFLYQDESNQYTVRIYRGNHRLEEFSFYASPEDANQEQHIALARAEAA